MQLSIHIKNNAIQAHVVLWARCFATERHIWLPYDVLWATPLSGRGQLRLWHGAVFYTLALAKA